MPLPEKTLGPFTFKIDRPEGYVKEWPGGRSFTYPCDYGYFPRHKGEDGEGLDAFVGDDPGGHLESFQKLRRDDETGRMVPDETKFLLGVDDVTREIIYRLYGAEVNARRVYRDFDAVADAIARFKASRKPRYKAATYRNPFPSVTAQGPQQLETQDDFEHAFARMRKQAAADAVARYGVNTGRFAREAERASIADKLERAFDDASRRSAPGGSESVEGQTPIIEAGAPR